MLSALRIVGSVFGRLDGWGVIVVKKDPLRRGFEIVHLPASGSPDERGNARYSEQQGDREGNVNRGHGVIIDARCGRWERSQAPFRGE